MYIVIVRHKKPCLSAEVVMDIHPIQVLADASEELLMEGRADFKKFSRELVVEFWV
ncbi:unnamed protein product [marine sediment metagenome]|uniref:Uncharacterized protein n=1 Tax=marine sediment metagenome TaxID=412755 RepID=X1C3F4_9ZZZZ